MRGLIERLFGRKGSHQQRANKAFVAPESLTGTVHETDNVGPAEEPHNSISNALNQSIQVLDLSTRAYNVLASADLITLEAITRCRSDELSRLPNCGRITLEEIRAKLHENGLTLVDEDVEHTLEGAQSLTKVDRGLPPGTVLVDTGLDDIPVSALALSTRPRNCLRRAGIATLGQIRRMSDEELLGIWNMGRTSLSEIREAVTKWEILKGYIAVGETATNAAKLDIRMSCTDEDVLGSIIASFFPTSGGQEKR